MPNTIVVLDANSVQQTISTIDNTIAAAGSPTANVQSIQGISGMTAVQVTSATLALDTSVNGLLVSQGSTTSGEKGPLIQGAVSTNAPAYTTAQTSPLSLDTSGLLRVSLKDTPANTNNLNVALAASSATVTVTGTVTANQGGAPWSANITQFGGTNVVTGTGASGSGIPRVTVANDSNILATQSGTWTVQQGGAPWSQNLTQVGGAAVALGQTTMASSIPVAIASNQSAVPVSSTTLALESGGNLAAISGVAGTTADAAIAAGAAGTLSAKLRAISRDIAAILAVTGTQAGGVPWAMYLDDQNNNLDDDGNLYVNTNVPGADISTGANQLAQTTVLQQIAAGAPVSQQGSWTVGATQSGTWTVQQGGAPWSVVGTLSNNNAAPGANNIGALIALAGSANPSYTSGDQVLLSTDLSGNLRVTGSLSVGGTTDESTFTAGTSTGTPAMGSFQTSVSALTNNQLGIIAVDANRNTRVTGALTQNNAAPAGTSLLGVMPAVASSAAPTYSAGNQVLLSTDLSGNLRVTGSLSVGGTTDETAFTAGTSTGTPSMGSFQSTVSALANNQVGMIALDQYRNTLVNIAASSVPLPVYLDDRNTVFDDDGIPYVNPNVPGADIATGQLQQSQLTVLQQIAAGTPVTQVGAPWSVSGTVTANQGAANATPWNENVAQFGGNAVVTGTGASGSGIPRVTVSNDSNILATQSGTWTVTANAGTNLNTSALALDTSVNGILVSQGSTTSGEKGPLIQGAVTTSAPAYTTAQTSPLSLDTSGNLRVSLQASGATVTVSGTVTANQGGAPWSVVGTLTNNNAAPAANNVGVLPAIASTAAQAYTSGDQVLLNTDLSGFLKVNLAASGVTVAENLTQVGGAAIALGQTTMANSIPVAIASNQSNLPENLTQVGGAAIALGQTTMANSFPVTIASNQSALPVTLTTAGEPTLNVSPVTFASPQPVYLDDQNMAYDDDGNLYVNTNVPGADIATGANQLAQTTALQQIAAGVPASQAGAWNVGATVSNFPAVQTVTLTPNPISPIPVYLDDRNMVLDDNGIPFVNINLDGADVFTPISQIAGVVAPTGTIVPSSAALIGGNAATALPTPNLTNNLTGVMTDKFGRQVVLNSTIRDLVGTQTTTISASTSETTIVTAATAVFNDLIMLVVSNTSASTNTRIDFRDTTGGSVLFSLQSNGGQPPVGFTLATPVPQTGVNTNWTATCATSTTDIRIYAIFAKNR